MILIKVFLLSSMRETFRWEHLNIFFFPSHSGFAVDTQGKSGPHTAISPHDLQEHSWPNTGGSASG